MKKLFTKIVGISIGIAMAVGVGASIVATSIRDVSRLDASSPAGLTFSAACGGSATDSDGNTWTITSDAAESTFDSTKGIHYGTGSKAVSYINLTTSGISGTITQIVVNASGASGTSAKLNVTVGGSAFDSEQSLTSTATPYTLTDSASGTIVVAITQDSAKKALYCKSVSVTYSSGGGGSTTLDVPTNLSASGTVLSWTSVANNNGYSYSINTTPEATTGDIAKDATSFDAAELKLTAGSYSFSLKAKGNGSSYLDSGYCDGVSFTMPNYSIDTFEVGDFAATTTSYTEFSISGASGANYVGFSAKPGNPNTGFIQFNKWDSPKNRSIATSETCGYIRKVSVTWGNANSNTLTVYVGNSPYSSSSSGDSGTAQAKTLSESNTIVDITGNNKYVSLYPNAAVYPASVSFYWEQVTFTQNLSASAASAYTNETITVSSDATNPVTWSVVEGSGTTATGPNVTPAGVVSVTGAGTVTLQAVSNSYNNATIQVTFNEPPANVFAVSFNSNGGSESPDEINVADGNTFEFPSAGTKEHYSFDGWTSTGSEPYYAVGATSPAVTGAITYTAHWTEDSKYTVTYNAGANGSGSYAHLNNYGGTYTLLAFNNLTGVSAADGYRFKDYTVNGDSKNPGDTFTLSGAVTVTVNFEEIPLQYTVVFGDVEGTKGITDFSNTSFVIPAGVTLNNIQGNVYGSDSNEAVWLRFGKSGTVGSFDATIDSQYAITRVVANLKYYGSDTTAKFAVTSNGGEAIEKTMTNSFADYAFDVSSSYTNKVTLGTTVNGKRAFLSGFTIEYEAKTNRGTIEHTPTVSALRFNYSGASEISGAAIRFGAFVSDDLWTAFSNETTILGYGVLIAETSYLENHTTTIKDEYAVAIELYSGDVDATLEYLCGEHNGDEDIRRYTANGASPATANSEQKAYMGVSAGDTYYTWQVRINFGSKFTTHYSAVAFIKTADGLVFFDEISVSAKSLATAVLPSVDSELPVYEPIQYVANRP